MRSDYAINDAQYKWILQRISGIPESGGTWDVSKMCLEHAEEIAQELLAQRSTWVKKSETAIQCGQIEFAFNYHSHRGYYRATLVFIVANHENGKAAKIQYEYSSQRSNYDYDVAKKPLNRLMAYYYEFIMKEQREREEKSRKEAEERKRASQAKEIAYSPFLETLRKEG